MVLRGDLGRAVIASDLSKIPSPRVARSVAGAPFFLEKISRIFDCGMLRALAYRRTSWSCSSRATCRMGGHHTEARAIVEGAKRREWPTADLLEFAPMLLLGLFQCPHLHLVRRSLLFIQGYGDLDEDLLPHNQLSRRRGIFGERGIDKVRVRPRLRSSQRSHGGRVDRRRVLRPLDRDLGDLGIDGVSGAALLGMSRTIPCC
jgi:hypothetical protein